MRVWLRQQGGFIGWTIDLVSLDSERMSSEAARALQRAVATCGFFGGDDDGPRTAPLRRLRDALVGLQLAARR